MRRTVVAVALVLGACSSGGSRPAAGVVGAVGPKQAAEQFLASIKSEDVQATSIIWGSSKGPARELIKDRTVLEKRILVMQCNLNHDSFRIVSDLPSDPGKRNLKVEMRRGQLTAQTTMVATQGPNQRWFIENTDLAPMRGFCSSQPQEQKR
ncbi:MAG TPA: hypothetical protein VE861_10270 [Gemmatimonadaceae bacterium]|nr:hypothetical protein [Gemmatimonadaceae bacterium]